MKLFKAIYLISLSIHTLSFLIRKDNDDYILKFSGSYYNDISSLPEIEKQKDTLIKTLKTQKSLLKRKKATTDLPLSYDDFIVRERTVKLYISQYADCNVLVNDTLLYEHTEDANIVEHMILHNNAETIDPKGVFSNDIQINYFIFNKKLNLYTVVFNNTLHDKAYSVEYDYIANGLIKESRDSSEDGNSGAVNNTFIWKLFNENINQPGHNLTIEIYFNLGLRFIEEDVYFNNLKFNKTVNAEAENSGIVKYSWKGTLKSQEVMVIQGSFPMYLQSCGVDVVTFPMVFFGSVFIVLLIVVLYLIVSSLIFDEV
jgi:hypothetical protein